MKCLGILGGMSWESTACYYRLINQGVRNRLGGQHSAKLLINSLDFADIESLQAKGDWAAAGEVLSDAAVQLEKAGADGLLIATNTMHRVAPLITEQTDIPLLHITDATGETIRLRKMKTVGLLGTRFTMEQAFYRDRLEKKFGLNVLIPEPDARNLVHNVIYDELVQGKISASSKTAYIEIINALAENGAEAVILGCTEIGLLVQDNDADLPLIDTTVIHAESAVDWLLSG